MLGLSLALPNNLIDHGLLTGLGDVADHLLYLDLAGTRPMTGNMLARRISPTTTYTFNLGTAALRWNQLHVGRVRSVQENGASSGFYTATFSTLGSGYYVMSGDDANSIPMLGQAGDTGTGGPATAFMGLFSFVDAFGTVESLGVGDSAFQTGNVGLAVTNFSSPRVTHQALGQGSLAAGSCFATVIDSASILKFGTTSAATGAAAIGSCNYESLTGLKTLTMLAEAAGAVVMGFVTSTAAGATTSSLRATVGGAFAQAYVLRGVALASNFGASLSGYVSATNNTAGITSSGFSSAVNAAIFSTGSAVAQGNAAIVFASVTGAASATASGDGSGVFGQTAAVAMTAAFANSFQFGPGAVPQADVLAVGVAGTGIALKGTDGAFTTPLTGQIYTSGGVVFIQSNSLARNISLLEQGLSTQTDTKSTTAVLTEQDLHTYTIPANTLTQAGDCIVLRGTFKVPSNARLKTVKVYFGASGTPIRSTGLPAAITGATLHIIVHIYRVTATTQKLVIDYSDSTGLTGTNRVYDDTQVEDLTTALVLKGTGTVGAGVLAGDITSVLWHVSVKRNS